VWVDCIEPSEVEAQIHNELALYDRVKPIAVVTGFNLSNSISCRAAGIPLVWLTHSTWMLGALLDAGLATWPDMLDFPPLNWLPDKALLQISKWILSLTGLILRPYSQVAAAYGQNPFSSLEQIWAGDCNLLAEPKKNSAS
jgi:hypothetical protein